MHLENSRHNLQILCAAAREGTSTVLKSPSGKFKKDTIFERANGYGRNLLAKIQGNSYTLQKISVEEAKSKLIEKFSRQIEFFSEIKNLDNEDRTLITALASDFVTDQLASKDNTPKSPGLSHLRARKNEIVFQNALRRIKSENIFDGPVNTALIKEQLLDEKYFQLKKITKNSSISLSEIEANTLDKYASQVNDLMQTHGETMRNAIILVRLMETKQLIKETDDVKYKIAKTFADRYLVSNKQLMNLTEFSTHLANTQKAIILHEKSKQCLQYLNSNNIGLSSQRKQYSIIMAVSMQIDKPVTNVSAKEAFGKARIIYEIPSSACIKLTHAIQKGMYDEEAFTTISTALSNAEENNQKFLDDLKN